MNNIENLKIRIEEERKRLDKFIADGKIKESYQQSMVVDGLVEEYIEMAQ